MFEDSHCTFLDDSNRMLGKGGFGFVFEGELRSKVYSNLILFRYYVESLSRNLCLCAA